MPWEKSGEEFDAERAKSYIIGLSRDIENLKSRNKDLAAQKKDAGSGTAELKAENLKLKVQLNTGLNDRQIARLTGDTFDEMMEDAAAYAEETGVELRSAFDTEDDPTGTPGNDQGDPNDVDDEGQRQVGRNFKPPVREPGRTSEEAIDYDALAREIGVGY